MITNLDYLYLYTKLFQHVALERKNNGQKEQYVIISVVGVRISRIPVGARKMNN